MTSIVVRGDAERFCLSADPTCTGINPCRVCWETVRDNVMPAAMRAANCTATPNQVMGFIREHFTGWMKLLMAAQTDRPDLFAKIVQMRQSALDKEWADARQRNIQHPLTPFGALVVQIANSVASAPTPQPTVEQSNSSSPNFNGSAGESQKMEAPEWPPDHFDDEVPLVRGDVKRMVRNETRNGSKKKAENSIPNDIVNGSASSIEEEK